MWPEASELRTAMNSGICMNCYIISYGYYCTNPRKSRMILIESETQLTR